MVVEARARVDGCEGAEVDADGLNEYVNYVCAFKQKNDPSGFDFVVDVFCFQPRKKKISVPHRGDTTKN